MLLQKVESATKEIGLTINSKKTEYASFNNPQGNLVNTSGASLSQVTDFQYLGSWVESTKKDVEVRIAKSWAAFSKLNNARQSDHLSKDLKINFFRAAVESVHTLWLRELDNDEHTFKEDRRYIHKAPQDRTQ